MTPREELLRRALLHSQAAELLRQDARCYKEEARRLREEAARFGGNGAMAKLLTILKRIPLKFRLWRLEKKIDRVWDRDLSLQIDQTLRNLEGSQP